MGTPDDNDTKRDFAKLILLAAVLFVTVCIGGCGLLTDDRVAKSLEAERNRYISGRVTQEEMNILRDSAEHGNTEAQYILGLYYVRGMEENRNTDEGMFWLVCAADGGYADAQFDLGIIFAQEAENREEEEEAVRLLRRAARQGHEGAIRALRTIEQ